jgi:hypothetical protein
MVPDIGANGDFPMGYLPPASYVEVMIQGRGATDRI